MNVGEASLSWRATTERLICRREPERFVSFIAVRLLLLCRGQNTFQDTSAQVCSFISLFFLYICLILKQKVEIVGESLKKSPVPRYKKGFLCFQTPHRWTSAFFNTASRRLHPCALRGSEQSGNYCGFRLRPPLPPTGWGGSGSPGRCPWRR